MDISLVKAATSFVVHIPKIRNICFEIIKVS